jgi:hypothetical protein
VRGLASYSDLAGERRLLNCQDLGYLLNCQDLGYLLNCQDLGYLLNCQNLGYLVTGTIRGC